jgi:hypothetical protein
MFKNGANTAMDLKTFRNSNSNVNSDVLIKLDSGGDPTPGSNVCKITYSIDGLDRHTYGASTYMLRNTFLASGPYRPGSLATGPHWHHDR